MFTGAKKGIKKNGTRLAALLLTVILVIQLLGIDITALGASPYAFRGYNNENITAGTFEYAYSSDTTVSGTTVTMDDSDVGEAIGFINLSETGADISDAIDLGGLEIAFSTTTVISEEGEAGAGNDVPAVDIYFCSDSNFSGPDAPNVISTVTLTKQNPAMAGEEVLSSGAGIPIGTRALFVYLTGTNTVSGSDNTVEFRNLSLIIHDTTPPTCQVEYDESWTSGSVLVTITAADDDSGLEGIYVDGARVSQTSPYTFTVTENTSFSAYSKDMSGKVSDTVEKTIDNIDTGTPAAPGAMTLSHDTWTNTDVTVSMAALGTPDGSAERYVYQIGSGAWHDFVNPLTVSDNGISEIHIAVEDEAGNRSGTVSDTIYIDKLSPNIDNVGQTVSSGSCTVSVEVSDTGLSGINETKYALGSQNAAYFESDGTVISGGVFTVTTGGTFTIFVSDHAGNYDIGEYVVKTAPSLADISDATVAEDGEVTIPLTVSDKETARDDLVITATASNTTLIPTLTVNQSAEAVELYIAPAPDQYGGPVTITVEVEDETGEVVSDTFFITVTSENDPPVAEDDNVTAPEDGSVAIDVLANDTDAADGDTLTVSDPGTPSHGAVSIDDDGKIVYTPNTNYNGSDSFAYTVTDGNGGNASATVHVTVTAVGDAPIANNDSASTNEDEDVTINVLANDTDADLNDTGSTEALTIVSAEPGEHGTTQIIDGKIVYSPASNWSGVDQFAYIIQDTTLTQSTAYVTVTVSAVNDAPAFSGFNETKTYTIAEDAEYATISFEITDVETAADSLMLHAASLNETLLPNNNLSVSGLGDDNSAVSLVLTPAPEKFGTMTIRLSLGDGFRTITQDITLIVTGVNDAPTPGYDTLYFDEDDALTFDVSELLANDTDIEGDTISFGGIASDVGIGTLAAVDEDTYTYTPPADFDETTTFTYYVTDGIGSSIGTCELIARAGNDAPTLTIPETSYTVNEDDVKNIEFSISDLETSAAHLLVTAGSADTELVSTDGIAITNNGDGTCTMSVTPMPDAHDTDTITVTVSDGDKKNSDGFDLIIAPMPDKPVAVNDDVYVPLSGRMTFDVRENDRDVDGDSLTVSGYDDSLLPGHLAFDGATQIFTYTAQVGETGESTFTYTLSDGDEMTEDATATVTLDVHAVTHAPLISAISNQYIMEDGNTGSIPFSVRDADFADEITISVSSSNTSLLPENFDANIIVTDNLDGTYSLYLEPATDAYGTATVTVTATDKAMNTDTETLILRVYAQNDAPEANDDVFVTTEDHSIQLTALSNDSDPEGDGIYISYMEWPAHGTLSRSGDVYIYTPHGNFNGTETLTYLVSDGRATAPATVTITVTPINDAPVARSNWVEVANTPGASVTFNVLGNDYDVDSAEFEVYEIITPDDFRGNVVDNGDGTLTYTRVTASSLDNGRDDFQYRIIDLDPVTGDQLLVSNTATVYIGVDFVSSLTAYSHAAYCNEDAEPFIINLTHDIANPNGVDYKLTIDDTTDLGTFTVIDNTHVRFTPAPNANGDQSIVYRVTEIDSVTGEEVIGGESATSAIGLRVYPVNDAPTIDSAPDTISCDEDASAKFTVTFSDIDDDVDTLYLEAYGVNGVNSGPIPLTVSIDRSRTGGSAEITVTPTADTYGEFDVVVYVSDGLLSDAHTIHMTVNPVDDPPMPVGASGTLYEDTSITFFNFTADCDVDGDDLIMFIADGDGPANGTAVVNADNSITYTPDENYSDPDTPDTFTISVKDDTPAGLTATATVSMTVLPINDPPKITNLGYYYTTDEDTPKVITLTVTDVDNDLTGASSYTLTSDNTDLIPLENISIAHVSGYGMEITLTPTKDNYGVAHIGVTASDGALSTHRDFQLTVLSKNDTPVAVNDSAAVDEDVHVPAEETSVVIDLVGNDHDVEDTSLEIASIDNVTFGRVINNGNGTVTYYADGDHSGTETFDYTIMDDNGATDTAQVTVVITAKNDPPLARNDAIAVTEDDEDIVISVLGNDSDAEGDALTVTAVTPSDNATATTDGSTVTYTPDTDYYGTDTLTYTVSDGNGGTDTGTVTIKVVAVNDKPTLSKHASNPNDWEMYEDTQASFNFVIDDAETAFYNLIVEIQSLEETRIKTTRIKLENGDGYKIMTVTPELNQTGIVPISISVTDGIETETKIFEIEIIGVNDAPVMTAAPVTTPEDTPVNGSVSAADVENDPLTYEKAADPAHGTVTVYGDGTYTYQPADNYNGEDSFDVTVSDGADQDTQTVMVTVTPVNDAPTAVTDERTIPEDGEVTIDVLANDYDVDTDEELNAEPDTLELTYSLDDVLLADPQHGSVSISEGGMIVYTPSPDYYGTDTFEYNVFDAEGAVDTGTVTITISAVNDAPYVQADYTKTITEDHTATIPLTDVVGDVDGDALTVQIKTGASDGEAQVIGSNFVYTPTANWFGSDSFTYTVTDGELNNEGTVNIVVQSENDVPLFDAAPATMDLVEDGANGTGDLTVSDVETQDGLLVVTVVSSSNTDLVSTDDVLLESNQDGTWDVAVNPRDNKNDVKDGAATITLRVTDGEDSSTCTFIVNVSAVNDAPSDDRDDISVFEDGSKTYNAISDDDVDLDNEGDTLTITNVSAPSNGTAVSNDDGTITYTPTANFSGSDAFEYTVEDLVGLSTTVPVYVTVIPVNDDPVILPDPLPSLTTDEDNESEIYSFTVEDLEDVDSTLDVSVQAITNAELVDTITMDVPSDSGRSFTIMPAENCNGTVRIRIIVRDSDEITPGIDTAEFDFIINPINDGPQNGDDLDESTDEDTPVDIDVLANDDVDMGHESDTLTITEITEPENGTATLNADKTINYNPDNDWNGIDTFTYTVKDEVGLSNTFTVKVTVNAVNDAPVVTLVEEQTTYEVNEEADTISIEFTVTDVDNDAACGTTEIDITSSTNNFILVREGLAIRDNTGYSRYIDVTPYRQWNGTAEITISANDHDKTGSASFTYIVHSVPDPPVGDDVTTSIQEDHTYTVAWDSITDDPDIVTDGDVLTVEITTQASHGTAAVDGGNITYVPDDNWNGTDSFVYTVTDTLGATDTGTISLTVTPEPDNPVADNENVTLNEDTQVSIDVIDGDTDVDANDTINTHPDAYPELQTLSISIAGEGLTAPLHGDISIDEVTGEIVYTPEADFNGTDSFTYYVVDNTGRTGEGTVNVTINQVNDAPIADDDTASTNEDVEVSINVLNGDTDVDQQNDKNADPDAEVLTISIDEPALLPPTIGTIRVENGEIVYTPKANLFGVDTFEYNVDDGDTLDTGLVTVTVYSVNDKPVFTEKPGNMSLTEDLEDGVDTFSVTDVETNDALLEVTASSDNPGLIDVDDITIENLGDGSRRITVNPKEDQNGTATITLVVKDGDNETNEEPCTFTVTVEAVNDPPEGGNDEAETTEDAAVTIAATENDDVDEATNGDDENVFIISVDDPAHGTAAAINGDKDILYTPDANWNGVDVFNYMVEDADGIQVTFSVTVTVTPQPDNPAADDDSATTSEDNAVSIDVLDGDTDVDASTTLNTHADAQPELQTLSIDIDDAELTAPVHGDISIDEVTGEIEYTPDAQYNGSDSFTYYLVDNTGRKDEATVTVTITQVNDAPTVNPDTATVQEDASVTIDVLANDSDIDIVSSHNEGDLHYHDDMEVTQVQDGTNGSVEIVEDGAKVKYTPNHNFSGTDTFRYDMSDGHGGTGYATVTVTVSPVNDAPIIVEVLSDKTTSEDTATGLIAFTVYDVDDEETVLTVTATHDDTPIGLLQDITVDTDELDAATRSFVIYPNANQNGTSEITVTVEDDDHESTYKTFTLTVTPANDRPVGDDVTASITEDTVYTVAWESITDDVDIETNGDVLSVEITTPAGHGTATADDENITYTPGKDFNGADSFVYTVSDGELTDTGTITLTIIPDNDGPTADDVEDTIDEDTVYTVNWGTITHDPDIATNGDVLSVHIASQGIHGDAAVDGNIISYTPDKDYNGTDSFSYVVSDGSLTDTGTISLTIDQVNDNPDAVNDSETTTEETAVTINVLENDTDVDTLIGLNDDDLHSKDDLVVTSAGNGAHGTTSVVGNKQVTYTPAQNFDGIDTFAYTISDGRGGTDTATVTVLVGGENDAPVAVDDTISTNEDTQKSDNVLGNDIDVDGDTLSFVEFLSDVSAFGTISATSEGVVTFTPKADYNGSFDVGYRVSDGFMTDTATITIEVAAVDDAPDADGASKTTLEDTPVSIDTAPLISDVDDADNSNLTVTVEADGQPAHGSVSISGHTITYTPDDDYNGADSFEYTVTDNTNLYATATITMEVTPDNDIPVANDDTAATDEDKAVSIDVLRNDSDVDTDTGINVTPQGPIGIGTLGTPLHGSVRAEDGKIVYTPDKDYNGSDSFTYYATDGMLSAQATVTVTIGQVNDNPVAVDDTAQTTDGDSVTISVLKNDTDVDAVTVWNGDELHSLNDLKITGVSKPAHGTAVIRSNTIVYTAGATYTGADTLTYTISDGHGGSATATVRVTVLSANDPPDTPVVRTPAGGEVVGGSSVIAVTWTGSDIDGDVLSYTLEYYDGAAWHVVATGLADTTYDFRIPHAQRTTNRLRFRVKASDGQYTSGYGYSGNVTVDKDAPVDIVVAMREADGSTYAAGTWTNQSVTVTATDITDISEVGFSYALEDMNFAAGNNITVTSGVHNVFIEAQDIFGNADTFGGYRVRIDKMSPVAPEYTVALDGAEAVVAFTLNSDPGGSGNRYLILPDGTRVTAADGITWTTDKNGTYEFEIGDVAGNSATFTVTVDTIDETPPAISCDTNGYSYGDVSAEGLVAALIYTDTESAVTVKGFAVSASETYAGAYQSYVGDITIGDGQFYIHALAENVFGLRTYETFGPFIVEIPEPIPEVGEPPATGNVRVIAQDIGEGTQIRMPGGEWSDELVLEDIEPGTYIVEVMDEDGNVSLVEITITDEEIAAGLWNVEKHSGLPWWLWAAGGTALLILLIFLLAYNVRITVWNEDGKAVRRIHRLRRRKDKVQVDIPSRRVRGGIAGTVTLARAFTRRMRGNTLVVAVDGRTVLSTRVPDDADGRFEAQIDSF